MIGTTSDLAAILEMAPASLAWTIFSLRMLPLNSQGVLQ